MITVSKSNLISFAYTVKTLGKRDVTSADYQPFFDRLNNLGIKVEYKIPEKDTKGKLHYHGILYLRKGFFRKRICLKGFHVKLDELYDRKGWLKYIHKDVQYQHLEQQAEELEEGDEDSLLSIPDDDFTMPTKSLFE